ncbi:MAG: YicC/YloC family endoribonuclease [Pseudoxanthomonas sp.]|nr:YicC/YloC family endoribonuclease [Pseudoxanthomonas sp.]
MIRSMTGYAEAETATPWGVLSWDLRSVNHRFLEVGLRLPEELRQLDGPARERITGRLARGKVDASLRLRRDRGAGGLLQVDEALVAALGQAMRRLGEHMPANLQRVSLTEVLAWPGLLVEPEVDPAALQAAALATLEQALDGLVAARAREGERLAALLVERLDGIEREAARVRALLPEIRSALRARLESRLADLRMPLDPGRLEQEVVLNLQKLDVDEELDRLAGHVQEARRTLALEEAVGRRLDFLMQEFNREANTLGSKSVDARSTQAAVELKVLIEQMREQVQNIE